MFENFIREIEKGKIKSPGTKTFSIVQECCKDPLLERKLACFVSVSKIIEPFLCEYQTDKIMIPFLCDDLCNLLKKIMKRYLKISGNESALKLTSIDLEDPSIQLESRKIKVGYVAEEKLKVLQQQKKISELGVKSFKMEAKAFLHGIVKKMFAKCPLKYKLVRLLPALAPNILSTQSESSCNKFKGILHMLVDANRLDEHDVDTLQDDFCEWVANLPVEFAKFDKAKSSLDVLYYTNFPKDQFQSLWDVIKQLLLISHGQAAVERGFSLSKSLLKDNQNPDTMISMRLVKDFIFIWWCRQDYSDQGNGDLLLKCLSLLP